MSGNPVRDIQTKGLPIQNEAPTKGRDIFLKAVFMDGTRQAAGDVPKEIQKIAAPRAGGYALDSRVRGNDDGGGTGEANGDRIRRPRRSRPSFP
jgi:hypothetical protein